LWAKEAWTGNWGADGKEVYANYTNGREFLGLKARALSWAAGLLPIFTRGAGTDYGAARSACPARAEMSLRLFTECRSRVKFGLKTDKMEDDYDSKTQIRRLSIVFAKEKSADE